MRLFKVCWLLGALFVSGALAKEGTLSGSGTSGDPWLIEDYADLKAVGSMNYELAGTYRLTADIDASASASENSGAGFAPIGNSNTPFTGLFQGAGYVIKDLTIYRPSDDYVGLFGYTGSSAKIDSLGLAGNTVIGNNAVGGLVGGNSGTVSNSYSTGAVTGLGSVRVGGLVGYNYSGTVSGSYSTGAVTGLGRAVGGLVGWFEAGMVSNSYSTGAVTGVDSAVGGLVGWFEAGMVSNSYSTGAVTSSSRVGGLVGYNSSGTVSNSYSTGAVTGSSNVVGGLVGYNYSGTVSGSYWDTLTSGTRIGIGLDDNSQPPTGLSTTQMKLSSSFSGWDFDATWQILEGQSYPGLRTLDNAPFAFVDTLYLTTTFDLMPHLVNDYDVETSQTNLILHISSLSAGTTDSTASATFPGGAVAGDTLRILYRVGEVREALGDTLWGNCAESVIVFPNPAPIIAVDDTLRTIEDSPVVSLLSALLENPDDNNLVGRVFINASRGSEIIRNDTLVYTPDTNSNGLDSLKLIIGNGQLSDTGWVYIQVTPVNDAPVITSTRDTSANEDTPVEITITSVTVTDVDNNTDFSLIVYRGKNYTVSGDSVLPDENFNGTLSIAIAVTDGMDTSAVDTLHIQVTPVNDIPQIVTKKWNAAESITSEDFIGKIQYTDPDRDTVSYQILKNFNNLFTIDSITGALRLSENSTLDYESATSYNITVSVTDPSGLSDTANVLISVTDVPETSMVEITRVATGDSVWVNPDTLYINRMIIDLEWTEDGLLRFETDTLKEGSNIIVKKYLNPTKNMPGIDTLAIFVNTQIPKISLNVLTKETAAVTPVTIVEYKDPSDSAYYVNEATNQILVTVVNFSSKDSVQDSFMISAKLDTLSVSSSVYKIMEKIHTTEDVNPNGYDLSSSPVNDSSIAISYAYLDKGTGKNVKVTYCTDLDGNRILNEDGRNEYMISHTFSGTSGLGITVSYTTDASGKRVTNDSGSVLYTISYPYLDSNGNSVNISYTTDASQNKVVDEEGNTIYDVSYTYVNKYGNSAINSVIMILDTTAPMVKIVSPEDRSHSNNVAIQVVWTVDSLEQDTLNLQGLKNGDNSIIRSYRDKPGNEGSDTIDVFMQGGKNIAVALEKSLVHLDQDVLDEYYAIDSPEKESYAVSFLNVKTGEKEETLIGSGSGTKIGNGEEPYLNKTGTHLGPTLVVDVRVPSLDGLGNLLTLSDLVESDGLIALDSNVGLDKEKMSVADYVEKYCYDSFAETINYSDLSRTPLHTYRLEMSTWVYTNFGQFVDEFSFIQKNISDDYVNEAGVFKMYFELKPGEKGLNTTEGKLYGTGAYVFKVSVKLISVSQCDFSNIDRGTQEGIKEDALISFGYIRPEK